MLILLQPGHLVRITDTSQALWGMQQVREEVVCAHLLVPTCASDMTCPNTQELHRGVVAIAARQQEKNMDQPQNPWLALERHKRHKRNPQERFAMSQREPGTAQMDFPGGAQEGESGSVSFLNRGPRRETRGAEPSSGSRGLKPLSLEASELNPSFLSRSPSAASRTA